MLSMVLGLTEKEEPVGELMTCNASYFWRKRMDVQVWIHMNMWSLLWDRHPFPLSRSFPHAHPHIPLYSARNEPTHRHHQQQDRLHPCNIALGSPRSQELVYSGTLSLSNIGRGVFNCALSSRNKANACHVHTIVATGCPVIGKSLT